jgi:hypothetical protein
MNIMYRYELSTRSNFWTALGGVVETDTDGDQAASARQSSLGIGEMRNAATVAHGAQLRSDVLAICAELVS